MERITIHIKDKKKARKLVNFLKTLDFIEKVSSTDLPVVDNNNRRQDDDFFALAGLWEGRNISLKSIREKAWPYQT